ncbi:MAG: hypothetical protein ILA24_06645 [Ruminococcus sp.]|nr:hypothetical protein [Ruminococcus sp.]
MEDYTQLKQEFNTLTGLMTGLVEKVGGSVDGISREDIERGFRVEYLSYAVTLAVVDYELTAQEVKSLEDIFGITLDIDSVKALATNYKEFLERQDDVPNIYKIAVAVDNAIASNDAVTELLSTRVSEMYSKIASAIIASDDDVAESELMVAFHLADRFSVYAEKHLSQDAKKKMMVLEG